MNKKVLSRSTKCVAGKREGYGMRRNESQLGQRVRRNEDIMEMLKAITTRLESIQASQRRRTKTRSNYDIDDNIGEVEKYVILEGD